MLAIDKSGIGSGQSYFSRYKGSSVVFIRTYLVGLVHGIIQIFRVANNHIHPQSDMGNHENWSNFIVISG